MSCILCYQAHPWWILWVLARLQASLLQSSVLFHGISMDWMNATWSEGPRLCVKLYTCEYIGLLCRLCAITYIMWGWSRCLLLHQRDGYVSLAVFPHMVYVINVCHLWVCVVTSCSLCVCTDIGHFSVSPLTVGKRDKSTKSPVFVCLSGLRVDLLHSHVPIILDKRLVCEQSVSFGMSCGPVHELC